jgi:very-short-patch-repair endonuclease
MNNDQIDNQWPKPIKELSKILGSTRERITNIKSELYDDFIEDIDYKWSSKRGSPKLLVITKEGAIKIAKKLPNEKAANFLAIEGIEKKHKITHESHYIEIIKEAINNLTPAFSQYHIDGYRIDLYLPDLKLAIECDERGHKHYSILKHEFRQHYIEQKMQCQFIRFDPHKEEFNIGTVINKIFLKIILKNNNQC